PHAEGAVGQLAHLAAELAAARLVGRLDAAGADLDVARKQPQHAHETERDAGDPRQRPRRDPRRRARAPERRMDVAREEQRAPPGVASAPAARRPPGAPRIPTPAAVTASPSSARAPTRSSPTAVAIDTATVSPISATRVRHDGLCAA